MTLTGPGGIGKTRLAVAAAARRADPDGMWLAELAEITSPDDVPRAVASVLGIRENPGQRLTQSLVTALRSRRALLVLDNCEHVIDAAARLAQAIVTSCPDVRVLATSREALGLGQGHERLVAVPPLDPAGPGTELFLERAAAAGVDLRAERAAVAEICRRLDGVPLAIELAAARATSLAPAELLARLDDQLRLLTGGPRAGAERHRTLRAAITWSYDLLSPAEQWLLVRLSVFTGPFGAAAAAAVAGPADGREASGPVSGPASGPASAGPGMDVDELLGGLVTRSMLAAESGPFGRRFRMLETMRQFAAGRLAEAEAGAGAGVPAGQRRGTPGGAWTRSPRSGGCWPGRPRPRASRGWTSCGRTCGPRSTGPAPAATATSPTRSSAASWWRSTGGAGTRSATGSSGCSPWPRRTRTWWRSGSPGRPNGTS